MVVRGTFDVLVDNWGQIGGYHGVTSGARKRMVEFSGPLRRPNSQLGDQARFIRGLPDKQPLFSVNT